MIIESLEARRMLASVTGLVLVNADTGQDIGPPTSGGTLNLAALPTRHLTVRADATSDTQSVKFRLDAINIFNHPQIANPNLDLTSTDLTFGNIATKTGQRQLQAVIRLDF